MKKWFENRLKTIMEHNEYCKDELTVKVCDKLNHWTPCDLILREYYNNGGGSSKGFLGITKSECIKCYYYILENKEELIAKDMINKEGYNNFGFLLWKDYELH